ncbi:MAG: hypothetical protein HY682_04225 [Chloroflexi bacterium]|nr:hypothetical protein [Chloroflexota bacterium]
MPRPTWKGHGSFGLVSIPVSLYPADKKAAPSPARIDRAKKATQPRSLAPQLATPVKGVPGSDDWLHEIKYDGYRIVCVLSGGKVRLLSRRELDWTRKFLPIAKEIEDLGFSDCILDGEVVAAESGGDGRAKFQTLQNVLELKSKAQLQYYVFDVPFYGGYNLRGCELADRKRFLEEVLAGLRKSSVVRYSTHIVGDGPNVFEHACRLGLEGIISKYASSRYVSIRTRSWVKVKCAHGQEFVIVGYTDPKGSRNGFGALLLGFYKDDDLIYCGKVGTGFDEETLRTVHARLSRLERKSAPVSAGPIPHEKGIHWVRPELVAQIAFGEWTDDGRLRHPAFQDLRLDKKAADVRREG